MGIRRAIIEERCRPFAYLRAVAERPYPALLESSGHSAGFGRFSLLCWDPFRRVTCFPDAVEVADLRSGKARTVRGEPFRVLAREFDRCRLRTPEGFDLPFAGGAVGYFSYDLRHRIERLPRLCEYDLDVPGYTLCFYDRGLVFDHGRGVTEWVGPADAAPKVPEPAPAGEPPLLPATEVRSNFGRAEYVRTVQRVKDYIAAGDIFQANLSQRFSAHCPADGLDVYGRLRRMNPAPFSAYLRYPGFEILSSSPERFLLVNADAVTTRPIKGTRPRRPGDAEFNRAMVEELKRSAKDHAELAMIVDLERNDLGRVCSYGTVRVPEHAAVETYETVFHLVSTVTGHLHRDKYDEFDLIRATFPGGSITGAPKIRAMEIIEELEPHARNVYTGSIGYISFHGRMDLNIAIRTMVKQGRRIYANFGGGIVADSDPELEYEETLHKGKAVLETLNPAVFEHFTGGEVRG